MTRRQSWFWKGVWSMSRTMLCWGFYWATSHFPSKEMSLLDPSLAARSESQRHRFSAASPNFSGGFPHPCSFTQHVTNLVRGLLESSQAQDKLESNICSSKSPGNHRERQAWRTSPLGLTQSPSLPSLYPPSQLCGWPRMTAMIWRWLNPSLANEWADLHLDRLSSTWPWPLLGMISWTRHSPRLTQPSNSRVTP